MSGKKTKAAQIGALSFRCQAAACRALFHRAAVYRHTLKSLSALLTLLEILQILQFFTRIHRYPLIYTVPIRLETLLVLNSAVKVLRKP